MVRADGSYTRETKSDGTTKHSRHCKAAFGRRDLRCARCLELRSGAAPREGWQPEWFAKKAREGQRCLTW